MGNLHPSIFFSQREMRNWTAFYALGERELDFLSGGKGRCAHCFQGGGARQAEYRLTCTRKYKDASGEDRE